MTILGFFMFSLLMWPSRVRRYLNLSAGGPADTAFPVSATQRSSSITYSIASAVEAGRTAQSASIGVDTTSNTPYDRL